MLQQKWQPKTWTNITTNNIEDQKSLDTNIVVCKLTDMIWVEINNLFPNYKQTKVNYQPLKQNVI